MLTFAKDVTSMKLLYRVAYQRAIYASAVALMLEVVFYSQYAPLSKVSLNRQCGVCCSLKICLAARLQAHPPIHPTKHTAGEHSWNSEKARLYEFIVRSFLATCSKAAVGFETRLEVQVAGEGFSTTGTLQPFKHAFLLYLRSKQVCKCH